ncbi:adenine phosphoribosyltransferase [Kribbella sp. ALI-6-A]|uniref:adenine phosphoribosyltransferase n=1 Tax=Kribbella sp. ALI-6-A TaxID=1933817 RepID=UPI00097BD41D|nr:adenine phosphoribosyltransferase [Kribbella sp. ALI-6-A]ONI74290.1 adenine phosphoribosyltransferase [Kribbella sp. ALI-6-A]
MRSLEEVLAEGIRDIPDYPQPGVLFKDITPLLADHTGFTQVVEALAASGKDDDGNPVVDKVVGIEARGFILAAPVALALGAGFVPVRKQGKLPAATFAESYALEYGEATIEVHQDAFTPGDRVLVIDDVLATGGTVEACLRLIRRCGAEVLGTAVLLELSFLPGRKRLADERVDALVTV